MAELRGCHGFEHKDVLDKTFGVAVRVMGPRVVLETVPLQTALSQSVLLIILPRIEYPNNVYEYVITMLHIFSDLCSRV